MVRLPAWRSAGAVFGEANRKGVWPPVKQQVQEDASIDIQAPKKLGAVWPPVKPQEEVESVMEESAILNADQINRITQTVMEEFELSRLDQCWPSVPRFSVFSEEGGFSHRSSDHLAFDLSSCRTARSDVSDTSSDWESLASAPDDSQPCQPVLPERLLKCRLLSGRMESINLGGVFSLQEALDRIGLALGIDAVANQIQILVGDQVIDTSVGSSTGDDYVLGVFRHAILCDEELTILASANTITWRADEGFQFKGKLVDKITRASSGNSEYVIFYKDESHRRHPGSPQLQALFNSLVQLKRTTSF